MDSLKISVGWAKAAVLQAKNNSQALNQGAGAQRAVIVDGKVEIATVMTVTMSCDHRVVDGATGARFLQVFKQYIEEPAAMLL